MYNDVIKNNIINSLGSKITNIADAAIMLASQGYFINKNKYIKLDWSSILIDAFENIDIFNKEQQDKLELLYNKISTL